MRSEIRELVEEVTGFIEAEGYKVIDTLLCDYGRTVRLIVRKDRVENTLPIVGCFYDTDQEGRMTKFHGVVDIRQTPWYQEKKRAG